MCMLKCSSVVNLCSAHLCDKGGTGRSGGRFGAEIADRLHNNMHMDSTVKPRWDGATDMVKAGNTCPLDLQAPRLVIKVPSLHL